MNKQLINLQKSVNATCVLIKTEEYKYLTNALAFKASVSDSFLFNPQKYYADKLNSKAIKDDVCHLIVTNLDEASIDEQERFVQLVKDREISGYNLPNNCILVFTVQDEQALKKISSKIYHFAVNAL